MVMMAGQQQQYTSRYPSISITVQNEKQERLVVAENRSNSRTRRSKDNYRPFSFQQKNVYYNSNYPHQQQQCFTPASYTTSLGRHQQPYYNNYDRIYYHYQRQPIRPLMEIKNDLLSSQQDLNDDEDDNSDISFNPYAFKQTDPKQHVQYRNRKAELDWDHAFDLDLIDLYTTHTDIDSHSLISTMSSSGNSFSSV